MSDNNIITVITTDGGTDIPAKELYELGVAEIMPIYTTINGKSYKSIDELSNFEMYKICNETKDMPKTAAPSPLDYKELFEKASQGGKFQVVHIGIGSNFSSAFNNARLAAEDFENVYIADSNNLSSGTGLLVLKALDFAKEGLSAKEIYEKITELSTKIDLSFILDTLLYLKKGGRCSTLELIGSSLLKIKLCLDLENGILHPGKKYRGSLNRCIKTYIKDRLENRTDINTERVFITHTMENPEFAVEISEMIRAMNIFDEIRITDVGLTVGTHCGPNTLGITFLKK